MTALTPLCKNRKHRLGYSCSVIGCLAQAVSDLSHVRLQLKDESLIFWLHAPCKNCGGTHTSPQTIGMLFCEWFMDSDRQCYCKQASQWLLKCIIYLSVSGNVGSTVLPVALPADAGRTDWSMSSACV